MLRWFIAPAGGGSSVLPFTSVMNVNSRAGARIATKPMERGAFRSANKWSVPYNVEIVLTVEGTDTERNNFMAELERLKNSTDLVDIVTPFYVWANGNIVDYDLQLDNDTGANSILIPSIMVEEVRLKQRKITSSNIDIGGAKNPGNTSTVKNGKINTTREGSYAYNWKQARMAQQTGTNP